MTDIVRKVGQYTADVVRETTDQRMSAHGGDQLRRGFTSATQISLLRIQEKLDSFRSQMKGAGLTRAEQAVRAQLEELKSELEAGFDHFWRGSGVDWRPPKPIAKGSGRPTSRSARTHTAPRSCSG